MTGISMALVVCGLSESVANQQKLVDADQLVLVDCLLPGQLRVVGNKTYVGRRRPVKSTVSECQIRGGEYVAFDQADYKTALNIWLPQAEAGDPAAQTHVGEIFEKGLGTAPNYELASRWYFEAAQQGFPQGQSNLGYLYEKGLGVEQNGKEALNWYRKASGLKDELVFAAEVEAVQSQADKQIALLNQQLAEQTQEAQKLQFELQDTLKALTQQQDALDTNQQELKKTKENYETLKKKPQSDTSSIELQNLSTELLEKEAILEEKKAELEFLRKRADSKEKQLSLKLQTAEQQSQTLNEELNRTRNQETVASDELDELKTLLMETQQNLTISQDLLANQRALYEIANEQVDKYQQEIQRLKGIDDTDKSAIEILTKTLAEREALLARHKEKIETMEVRIRNQESKITELRQKTPDATDEADIINAALKKIKFGKYYAIVIGNRQYIGMPTVESAVSDANAVSTLLKQKYGFETLLLENANRDVIYNTLDQLRRSLTEQDNLLIYYAGHGYLVREDLAGYWLPVDSQQDSRGNWISNREIADQLSAIKAKHILVIADACYSDSMTNSASSTSIQAKPSTSAQVKRLASLAKLRSRTVMRSGGERPLDQESGGPYSVFATALLNVLTKNDSIIEAQSIASQVSKLIRNTAGLKQKPGYDTVRDAGHGFGDFLFVPRQNTASLAKYRTAISE